MKIPVIDLHADSYTHKTFKNKHSWMTNLYYKNEHGYQKLSDLEVINPDRLKKGNVKVQTQSLFISDSGMNNPLHTALWAVSLMKKDCKEIENYFQVFGADDIQKNLNNDKTGLLISIEGLEVIENNLDLLDIFYEVGVRIVAPTWNRILPYNAPMHTDYGLFPKGKDLIKKLNELGFVIDVSHSSEKSFFEIMNLATVPVIATHSDIKALNKHPRNLSDNQLKALDETKGVFGINFYPNFMKPDNYTSKSDTPDGFEWSYRIVDYVASKFSIDIIAIGSDYDGIHKIPQGLETPEKFPDLADFLMKKSLSQNDVEKIFYKNALRILERIS